MATHDYTNPRWGHDYIFEPIEGGRYGSLVGWGLGIKNGDYLLLANGKENTRYKVTDIQYYPDPPGMWKAQVTFAPRRQAAPTGGTHD